jgi:hypothetical protein
VNRLTICLLGLACATLAGCAESPVAPLPSFAEMPTGFSSSELDYFEEIALGVEYGHARGRVLKWNDVLRIKVHGSPTAADRGALAQVLRDLNGLIGSERLSLVDRDANVELWFAPASHFPVLEPSYVPGNRGFVWIHWNGSGVIQRARILIASDQLTSRQRAHLIREELTQALGLLRDSDRYPESVFFRDWSETTEYAAIDEAVVRMLYRSEVRAGMPRAEVMTTLRRIVSP